MPSNLWWFLFFISLAGNVFGWAVTLLRILQSLEGTFAKLCLAAQLIIPLGLPLAFLFGWLYGTADRHRQVMWVWTASLGLFGILAFWE